MKSMTAAILAIGFAAATVHFAGAANAADPVIPKDSEGSITVHKFEQPEVYAASNYGMELPTSVTEDLVPYPGASFQVSQLGGIDLTTHTGWRQAEAVVEAFDPLNATGSIEEAGAAVLPGTTLKTNSDGEAKFDRLPVGVYLVVETGAPPAEVGSAVTMAMPFLVTVPLTDPEDLHEWVYDVHVYPKNTTSMVTKEVDDGRTVGTGESVVFTITATIPGGSTTTKFEISDTLDRRLTFEHAALTIGGQESEDFTVKKAGSRVTVQLGASAREAAFQSLKKDPDAVIEVSITATVTESGEISNGAQVVFSRAGEWETTVDSLPVETKFGGVRIKKTNGDGQPLEGATFQVRTSQNDDFQNSTVATVAGESEWVTDKNGEVTLDGLRYSAWANGNGAAKDSDTYNYYWLVETKAPAGYELLSEPIPFEVSQQASSADVLSIVNTPHNAGGRLPDTGTNTGAVAATVGLLTIAAGAVVLGLTRTRRNNRV